MPRSLVIAVVGMAGSGKSTASDYLQSRGFRRVTFGDVTRQELDHRGLPHEEQHERVVRKEIRARHGADAYARLSLPNITQALDQGASLVIDGLYSWAEYRFLHGQLKGMIVVAIYTDRRLRYERLAKRPVRPLSPEQTEARDCEEIETLDKGGPIAMADYTLINNGGAAELTTALASLLRVLQPA